MTSQLRTGLSAAALVWLALGLVPPAGPGLLMDRAPRHARFGGLRVSNCGSQQPDTYGPEVFLPEPGADAFCRPLTLASFPNDQPTRGKLNPAPRSAVALPPRSRPPQQYACSRASALASPSRVDSRLYAAASGRGPPAL